MKKMVNNKRIITFIPKAAIGLAAGILGGIVVSSINNPSIDRRLSVLEQKANDSSLSGVSEHIGDWDSKDIYIVRATPDGKVYMRTPTYNIPHYADGLSEEALIADLMQGIERILYVSPVGSEEEQPNVLVLLKDGSLKLLESERNGYEIRDIQIMPSEK